MNSLTIRLYFIPVLLLFLSACVPYQHAYYPAGGTYSNYSVTQRNDYSGYRYSNHSYPYKSNYSYNHNGYNSYSSRDNGYIRSNPANDYSHNHLNPTNKQHGFQSSVAVYPDHKSHQDIHGKNNWSKPPSDSSWQHKNQQRDQPNSKVQNYGQSKNQRESHRKDHYQ
jgi:hypothetical protein